VQELEHKNQTEQNSGGVCHEEKLQEQLLDGSHLFALMDLEELENISPIYSEKVGLECPCCSPVISGIISPGGLSYIISEDYSSHDESKS